MSESIFVRAFYSIRYYVEKILIPINDPNWLKQFVIWVGAITGFLLGKENASILWILLLLIFIDWLTGLVCAMKTSSPVSSGRMASTAYKIVVYFSIVVTSKLCGDALGFEKIEKLIIAFYIAVEAYSILENAEKMGMPIPELFRQAIKGKLEQDKQGVPRSES